MPAAMAAALMGGLGLVPDGVVAHALRGAVRELDAYILEAEILVDIEDELCDLHRLPGDLVRRDEDMRIVLGERTDTHQAMQRARWLVAVHLAEFRKAQRQVAVAADALLEDLDVAGGSSSA